MEPEYLSIFSNQGDTTVRVRFDGSPASIREQRINPNELNKLVDEKEGHFLSHMYFDEHLMCIEKIEISIQKNLVTLHVRNVSPDENHAE